MPNDRIDAQGGDVVPLPERRRAATVHTAADGLPVVTFDEPRPVSNDESIATIRAQRAGG